MEGKGCPAPQEDAPGSAAKLKPRVSPTITLIPAPPVRALRPAWQSTEYRRDLQGSHPIAPSSQLTEPRLRRRR